MEWQRRQPLPVRDALARIVFIPCFRVIATYKNERLMRIKINTTTPSFATLLALAIVAASAAHGSTIVYDNLSPVAPYYHNYGNWLGTFGGQYEITATTFVPNASGQLDELTLGLFYQMGANSVTLRLSPDVAGLPSTPIWQTSVPPAAGYGALLNVSGIGGPMLTAGQMYWLEGVAPVTPTTLHGWYSNNQGSYGPIIASGNYGVNQLRFSLRVGVLSTVPEPGAGVLVGCGCLGMLGLGRRSRT